MNSNLTRRDLFALLARPFQRPVAAVTQPQVAVIQGRHCIALTSFCSVCVERCPVDGAMKVTNNLPSVVPDVCTGCGICHEVCPAPRNAVFLLPRGRTVRHAAAQKL